MMLTQQSSLSPSISAGNTNILHALSTKSLCSLKLRNCHGNGLCPVVADADLDSSDAHFFGCFLRLAV